jgi:hypothetical protein
MTMLKAPLENNIQANEQTNRFGYITQRSDSYIFDEKAFRSTYEDLWTRYQIDSPDISSYFRWHDKGDIPHQFDEPTCLTEEAALLLGRPLDDDILDDIHDLYLKLLTIQASVTWEKRLVEASIKAKCGTSPGIDGVCTWRRTLTHRQKLDLDTLRTEQPDIHSQFLVARAGAKALVVAKGRNFRRSRRHR